MFYSEENWKQKEIDSAKAELTKIEAASLLAKNNTFACEIHIAGLVIGLCDNKKILPALKHCKSEIEKYLKGEDNLYE